MKPPDGLAAFVEKLHRLGDHAAWCAVWWCQTCGAQTDDPIHWKQDGRRTHPVERGACTCDVTNG